MYRKMTDDQKQEILAMSKLRTVFVGLVDEVGSITDEEMDELVRKMLPDKMDPEIQALEDGAIVDGTVLTRRAPDGSIVILR